MEKHMKRVFGIGEAIFDVFYLVTAFVIGVFLLTTSGDNTVRFTAGVMAIVLAGGDSFHLIPRIKTIMSREEGKYRTELGVGKLVTSITMTIFYVMLWELGRMIYSSVDTGFWNYIVYFLAGSRIILCLFPQNEWKERYPNVVWGIYRNIPFFLLGILVSGLFFVNGSVVQSFKFMWFAILLSFAFYLPVVLWANKNPKIGMLMLPKTCTYLWMMAMCLSL